MTWTRQQLAIVAAGAGSTVAEVARIAGQAEPGAKPARPAPTKVARVSAADCRLDVLLALHADDDDDEDELECICPDGEPCDCSEPDAEPVAKEIPLQKPKTLKFAAHAPPGGGAFTMTVEAGEGPISAADEYVFAKPAARDVVAKNCGVPAELAQKLTDQQLLAIVPAFAAMNRGNRR